MFGATEQLPRSVARSSAALERIRGWLEGGEIPGVVLTGPGAVAWACGGVSPPVDRTAGVDLVWAVITRETSAMVTTEVEQGRILDEYDPASHGFTALVAVPWWRPEAFVTAAQDLAGAAAKTLASDRHPAFGLDASQDLIALRLALSDPEQDDLRSLGSDAANALQSALREWRPGQRDLDVHARVAWELESRGADTPVLIVGGDERLMKFRHPMAVGAPMQRLVMTVVVARRGGLHAAATRFASAGAIDPDVVSARSRVLRIDRDILAACRPGSTYGDVLVALDAAYTHEGASGGWAGHYQGGPIGFAQREFEIAPEQSDSPWYSVAIRAGHAVAWNPSLPGGAKVEDTYLITEDGLERLTDASGWPLEESDDVVPARPAILDVFA